MGDATLAQESPPHHEPLDDDDDGLNRAQHRPHSTPKPQSLYCKPKLGGSLPHKLPGFDKYPMDA